MGSYRNAYPSGAASASAAYRSAGDTHAASLLGLSSQGDGGLWSNAVGLLGRGSVYGYDSTLYAARHLNGGGLHQSHGRNSLARSGDIGGAALYSEDEGLRGSDLLNRSFLTDFHRSEGDMRVSHGYTGGGFFDLLSSETDVCTYGHISDTYVSSTYLRDQLEETPRTSLQNPVRKRKTPSLDEIIRETWQLHSLFRAGLAAASDVTESSTHDSAPMERWDKPSWGSTVGDSGWDLADKYVQKDSLFDERWHVASNGQFDNTSSWQELDVPTKGRKGATSNKKLKEFSPQLDKEQEQHASDLQRLTCERVAEFMGNLSDGDSSDNESFVDSDDDTPNLIADSSCDVKSREEQAFEFFLHTFLESKELQKLYREHCHVGKFDCLVCSSMPGRPAKKYNGLTSVIMHASKIIKTKKKQEHRGYARALCSAMGWDLCRLPTMPCSSSPYPRCCIPTNEEEVMGAKKTDEVMKAATQKEL